MAVTIKTPGENSQLLSDASIGAAYPNPFNPGAKLPLQLDQGSNVLITLHDIYGRKCQEIVSRYFASGDYQIPINASNLSSGIYILNITTENSYKIKKIIVQ